MRRNPATSRRRSTSGRSGRAARVCIWATFGTGTSDSNSSSATTTRRPGSSSAVEHDSSVVLPPPGGAGEHDRQPGPDAGPQERGHPRAQHVSRDQLAQGPERDAGELADVHKHMAAPGDVAELAVCGRGVVELGQGSARRGRRRRTPRRGSGTGPDADERRSWNRSWACPVSSSTLSEAIDGRSTCSRSPLRR
jgi:hypothetical protein